MKVIGVGSLHTLEVSLLYLCIRGRCSARPEEGAPESQTEKGDGYECVEGDALWPSKHRVGLGVGSQDTGRHRVVFLIAALSHRPRPHKALTANRTALHIWREGERAGFVGVRSRMGDECKIRAAHGRKAARLVLICGIFGMLILELVIIIGKGACLNDSIK